MYSIRIDKEGRDRYQNGEIRFARVHSRQSSTQPYWSGVVSKLWILRQEVHQWFEESGIDYTLHWRHSFKTIINCNDEELDAWDDFRWEVDVKDPQQAILVKLRWGI